MIDKRIENLLNLPGFGRLMVFDLYGMNRFFDFAGYLTKQGFTLKVYENVEVFRVEYEENIKAATERIAVIVQCDIYVPYDILQCFHKVHLSFAKIFPKLHSLTLMQHIRDIDLISFAYDSCYTVLDGAKETEDFILQTVFSMENIQRYCEEKAADLLLLCDSANRYTDWIQIAIQKAKVLHYAAMKFTDIDLSFADEKFMSFIQNGYGGLSSEIGSSAPAIITRTMSMICNHAGKKVALIVMDGMSLFDFEVISKHFNGISFELYGSFALIPTTTTISRQSMLTGKFPRELVKPFSLSNEEKEFKNFGQRLGYTKNQIQYLRGFNSEVSQLAKLVVIVVGDIDDIVHGQRQGRAGMYNDINLLGKNGKLQKLIRELTKSNFDVYISSDHGNTPCVGVGGFRSGVETETRSNRMTVLNDFAKINELVQKYTDEYGGYYLDKSYRYFICKPGFSFDSKDEDVMTHGGMTIDEVIVPFVKIKEVR